MSNTTTHRAPTLTAYSVRDFEKDNQTQSSWCRVGIAFQHRDGKGFDILLEALPVNGRIALRPSKPKSDRT